jgi:hypothetical protein
MYHHRCAFKSQWMIWNTGCKIPESARYLMDEGLVSDNFELTAIGLAMSTGTLSPAALNGSASYTYLNMTEVDFSDSLVATVVSCTPCINLTPMLANNAIPPVRNWE